MCISQLDCTSISLVRSAVLVALQHLRYEILHTGGFVRLCTDRGRVYWMLGSITHAVCVHAWGRHAVFGRGAQRHRRSLGCVAAERCEGHELRCCASFLDIRLAQNEHDHRLPDWKLHFSVELEDIPRRMAWPTDSMDVKSCAPNRCVKYRLRAWYRSITHDLYGFVHLWECHGTIIPEAPCLGISPQGTFRFSVLCLEQLGYFRQNHGFAVWLWKNDHTCGVWYGCYPYFILKSSKST